MEPLTVTPARRAVWSQLRESNHPYYRKVIENALKDTTASPQYASDGRWSGLARLWTGDPAFSRRAYDHVKNQRTGQSFENAAVLDGNKLREAGTEFAITYSWIADDLSEGERNAWRDWLIRSAEAFLKVAPRLNDSDHTTGIYFFLATLDRLFGTDYRTRPVVVQMREAVRKYCTVFGNGGMWPEGSEYSLGTMYLLFNGAEAAGIEDYPEVVAFREQVITFLPHFFVSDLKELFEHEDEESPNDPHWQSLENVFAYLSQFSPAIRQLEIDVRAACNRPAGNPLYPRYFVYSDPNGPVAPWKEQAGLFMVAPGVGQVISRRGWEPDDEAAWMWFPPYSLGMLDHDYGVFGELRIRDDRKWKRDRPQAYSGSVLLGNHTVIGGLGAPKEIGVFNGGTRIGDKVTYGSGTNAGVLQNQGRVPIATLLNEKTVSFVWLMDRDVVLKIERIHLADTTDLARFAESADDAKILAAPIIETLWQSQTTMPVVTDGVIVDDGRVQPLYACEMKVVDLDPLNVGTIAAKEKGWYTSVIPTTVEKFQILVTLMGEADVRIDRLNDVQTIRVRKAGFRDAVIYSSVKPGPVLTTTIKLSANGGKSSLHDPTKIEGIRAARAVTVDPAWSRERDADVYVEQADGLVQLATEPTTEEELAAARAEIDRLTADLMEAGRELLTTRARALQAEAVVQLVREAVSI